MARGGAHGLRGRGRAATGRGLYATSTSTPLYFAQAVGRFVRLRRRGETASVFLPTVPSLLSYAGEMEVERDHVLGRVGVAGDEDATALEDSLIAAAQREEPRDPDADGEFSALGSEAEFDRVLFDGGEFGTGAAVGSDEEADYLGIPGLLEPDQVTALLRRRQAEQQGTSRGGPAAGSSGDASPTTYERLSLLRRELNGLVGAWHHRTGRSHGAIHAELRRACGGPTAARAAAEELQARIDLVRAWAPGAQRTLTRLGPPPRGRGAEPLSADRVSRGSP